MAEQNPQIPPQGFAVPNPRPALSAAEQAETLLDDYLSDHQRWMRRKCQFFYVLAGNGLVYALSDGLHVLRIDSESQHPISRHDIWAGALTYTELDSHFVLPEADRILGQKLLLEAAPEQFHATACSTPVNLAVYARQFPELDGRYFAEFLRKTPARAPICGPPPVVAAFPWIPQAIEPIAPRVEPVRRDWPATDGLFG